MNTGTRHTACMALGGIRKEAGISSAPIHSHAALRIICLLHSHNGKADRAKKEAAFVRATGIVRRIDELGRVVIPKEIRRTLRIREGDPLEIYTDKDGEVILKKYSPIGEISNFAKDYTESLFRSLGHIACITDKDMIVSASGVSRKELWEKPISRDLEQAIQSRQVVTANRGNGTRLVPVTSEEDAQAYTAQVICPIIADGESIGAVVLLSREPAARMGDTELKVAETTASIVGRQMEQ